MIHNGALMQKELVVHCLTEKMENHIYKLYNKPIGAHKIWLQLSHTPKWYKKVALKKQAHLTRQYLMKQKDWLDWLALEHKQLDQYEAQSTLARHVNCLEEQTCFPFFGLT